MRAQQIVFVLVGGWPGSGKTTTAQALADELGLPYLAKDELKEALMDEFGPPETVEDSRTLGAAAVRILLRLAAGMPGAVIDSTWYDYAAAPVAALRGIKIEIRCVVPLAVARQRYADRVRDDRHLDGQRSLEELWGRPVAPLGVGPLIEVDTTGPVDIVALAAAVRRLVGVSSAMTSPSS